MRGKRRKCSLLKCERGLRDDPRKRRWGHWSLSFLLEANRNLWWRALCCRQHANGTVLFMSWARCFGLPGRHDALCSLRDRCPSPSPHSPMSLHTPGHGGKVSKYWIFIARALKLICIGSSFSLTHPRLPFSHSAPPVCAGWAGVVDLEGRQSQTQLPAMNATNALSDASLDETTATSPVHRSLFITRLRPRGLVIGQKSP